MKGRFVAEKINKTFNYNNICFAKNKDHVQITTNIFDMKKGLTDKHLLSGTVIYCTKKNSIAKSVTKLHFDKEKYNEFINSCNKNLNLPVTSHELLITNRNNNVKDIIHITFGISTSSFKASTSIFQYFLEKLMK